MISLDVEGVTKHFGPEAVLDGVTFDARLGQRIGLVGPNGVGKTTLLRIIAGRDDADAGTVRLHPSLRSGYLEQQPIFAPGQTLWEEARGALAALIAMQTEALEVAERLGHDTDPVEHKRLAARFDHLQHELDRHDGYNIDHKIERVLDGLRFLRSSFHQRVQSLSGGEQNRLMLAKLLLAEPEVMLLDEPSNHLDIEATQWLEEFLAGNDATMLLVSHDRYFLDKVTTHTLELYRGTVDCYAGNFSAYWRQKQERLLVDRRTYEKQQGEIAKTEDFIRRNAYGQKSAQAEDRRKKLARIDPIAAPREIAEPPMRFPNGARSGNIVLRVEGLAKAFARPLFSDVNCEIIRSQRWGLLGPNGSGKSTLLRCLLGVIAADAGQVSLGAGVDVGYFDQQLTSLDETLRAVDAIRPSHKDFVEQQRRDLLAKFGLTGDTALQEVGSLSGGERCRAALARLAALDANFLVLDEPTNHLDLWARDALERALQAFEGTVLFVSHDRYFIDRLADHLLVIDGGQVTCFEGNYHEYQEWLVRRNSPEPVRGKAAAAHKKSPSRKASTLAPAAGRGKSGQGGRRFPFRKLADLEKEIFQRENRVKDLNATLTQPDVHRDGSRVRRLKAQIDEETSALKSLYEHWEEASEKNW